MTDAYETPKSDLSAEKIRPIATWKKVVCTLLTLLAAGLYFLLSVIIPQFVKVFLSIDIQLPQSTLLILQLQPVYIPLAILSLAPLAIWVSDKHSGNWRAKLLPAAIIHAIFAIVFFIWAQASLFLPVLQSTN